MLLSQHTAAVLRVGTLAAVAVDTIPMGHHRVQLMVAAVHVRGLTVATELSTLVAVAAGTATARRASAAKAL